MADEPTQDCGAVDSQPDGSASRWSLWLKTLKSLKPAAEVLALVAGGIWAVSIFVTFQRTQETLLLEQARHLLKTKISIALPKLEIRRLRALSTTSVYEVKYTFVIAGASAKTTSVQVVALEWFIGTLVRGNAPFIRANLPDIKGANLPTTKGSIAWTSRGIEIHTNRGFTDRRFKNLTGKCIIEKLIGASTDPTREVVVQDDSKGGVGEYEPGETETTYRIFYVTDRPDSLVGFVLQIGVKNDDGSLWRVHSQDYEILATGTVPGKTGDEDFKALPLLKDSIPGPSGAPQEPEPTAHAHGSR